MVAEALENDPHDVLGCWVGVVSTAKIILIVGSWMWHPAIHWSASGLGDDVFIPGLNV